MLWVVKQRCSSAYIDTGSFPEFNSDWAGSMGKSNNLLQVNSSWKTGDVYGTHHYAARLNIAAVLTGTVLAVSSVSWQLITDPDRWPWGSGRQDPTLPPSLMFIVNHMPGCTEVRVMKGNFP